MTARRTFTDPEIRALLEGAVSAADDDFVIGGLADTILDLAAGTRQSPVTTSWLPSHVATVLGPGRLRAVIALAIVALLVGALAFALAPGRRSQRPLGDGSTFHGSAMRTGLVAGPGPATRPERLWTVQLDGPLQNEMPALDGTRLDVADGEGNVQQLLEDGARGWSMRLPKPAGSPSVAGDVLVVGAGDGLYGVDTASGAVRWRVESPAGAVRSEPAIMGDLAYAALADGTVVAVDTGSGAVRWRHQASGPVSHAVATDGRSVVVPGDDGVLTSLDIATGDRRWSTSLGPGALASPAIVDDVVYATTGLAGGTQHRVVALDAATGDQRWAFDTGAADPVYIGAVRDGTVFVVGEDGLVRRIRNGAQLDAVDLGVPIGSVATLSQGVLYVSASDGSVVALDADTLRERWRVAVNGDAGPAIVADGRLIVGSALGDLAAFADTSP